MVSDGSGRDLDHLVIWLFVRRRLEVFRVMEVTHTGSRQKPRRGEDFSALRALGNSEQPSG